MILIGRLDSYNIKENNITLKLSLFIQTLLLQRVWVIKLSFFINYYPKSGPTS